MFLVKLLPVMPAWDGQRVPASDMSHLLGCVPLLVTSTILRLVLIRWFHTGGCCCDFPCSKSELNHLGARTTDNYLVSTSAFNIFIKFLHFESG